MKCSNIESDYKRRLALSGLLLAMGGQLLSINDAWAYPEFQSYSEKKSGRTVDCAMCHTNANGPVGDEDGQIGKLTAEELSMLNQSRRNLDGTADVSNPILNKFGNEIVKSLGMRKVLELKSTPEQLAISLGSKSDLDEDGIADGKEFEQGTDPLNMDHGDPLTLFVRNLDKYKFHVALAAAAVFLLDFGFANLIKGMAIKLRSKTKRTSEEKLSR
jgi:hypothetical protein